MLSGTLKEKYPSIISATNVFQDNVNIKWDDKEQKLNNAIFTDKDFLDIISVHSKRLIGSQIFDKNCALISRNLSKKIFQNSEGLGEVIELSYKDSLHLFTIVGIYETFPTNSTIQGDIIINNEILHDSIRNKRFKRFEECLFESYVLLRSSNDIKLLNKNLEVYYSEYFDESISMEIDFQRFTNVYLHSGDIKNNISKSGNFEFFLLYAGVALVLLLITIINYQFLFIAKTAGEIKSIGIRKVFGASNRSIFGLFLIDSLIIIFSALILCLAVIPFLDKIIFPILDRSEFLLFKKVVSFAPYLLLLALIIGLITSFYISAYSSSLNPIQTIYRSIFIGNKGRTYKKVLLIIQIIVFIILISFSISINCQIKYALNVNQGYNTENLVLLYREYWGDNSYFTFKNELLKHPSIENISGALTIPPSKSRGLQLIPKPTNPNEFELAEVLYVDKDFIETFQLIPLQYKNNRIEFEEHQSIVITSSIVSLLGLKDPINEFISIGNKQYDIIGVVEDFFIHSIHQQTKPIILIYEPDYVKDIAIRLKPHSTDQTFIFIKKNIEIFFPNQNTELGFCEDLLLKQYRSERKFSEIILLITYITILSACIGLFAQSKLEITTRGKEISIRKIFGANPKLLIVRYLSEYAVLVIISNVIASPFAFYLTSSWLNQFYYQNGKFLYIYLITIICSFMIVIFSVTWSSLKLAKTNPIETLRQI